MIEVRLETFKSEEQFQKWMDEKEVTNSFSAYLLGKRVNFHTAEIDGNSYWYAMKTNNRKTKTMYVGKFLTLVKAMKACEKLNPCKVG